MADLPDEERHALLRYLGLSSPPDDPSPSVRRIVFKSSFWALLEDARGTAGRDIRTGEVVSSKRSSSWLAATGYLCWFDQVGRAVRLDHRARKGGFHAALRDFGGLTPSDVGVLFSLRNAFAHHYSLVSRDPKNRPGHHYVFSLDVDGPLIVPASEKWDGVFGDFERDATTTWVGLRALGELAETVREAVMTAWQEGHLRSAVDPNELEARYVFSYVA